MRPPLLPLPSALRRFPKEQSRFWPATGRLTIHEIVVHIADIEANSYVHCRRLIAEPGSDVLDYNEERWAARLDYHAQSTAEAVELFKWLRRTAHQLIRNLPESAWANTINPSDNGLMTLDDWIRAYERHIPDHVRQMRTVYEHRARLRAIAA